MCRVHPAGRSICVLVVFRGAGSAAREYRSGSTLNARRHRGRKGSVGTAARWSEGHACVNMLGQRERLGFSLAGRVAGPQGASPFGAAGPERMAAFL